MSFPAPDLLPKIVLDTCVLAPMPLCDTLLRLAESPALYAPRWSSDILRELKSTLIKMGYSEAQVTRRLTAMDAAFEDAAISGYGHLVESMTNHPKDRHVLAAAVSDHARAIVTHNIRDFPVTALRKFGVEALTPDEFLLRHAIRNPDLVRHRINAQAAARQLPVTALLHRLCRDLPRFTATLAS